MLTPKFKLSQDDNHVYINVHAPYTNLGDTEIDVEGENFLFVSSPYFLRLRLPGKIVDNDRSKGSYICESGDFNLSFDKQSPGEYFENLDMITSLLAPREIPDLNPSLVEELEDGEITIDADPENEYDGGNKHSYGFANKITTEFSNIGNEFPQIFELRVPEDVSIDERQPLRIKHENDKFSSDHYLADYYDIELLEPYLKENMSENTDNDSDFSDDEVGVLKELPNKNFLLTAQEYKQVLYGLIDILYGYCYDKRTTLNESTVESSWTINKLSSTLSWFCTFKDVHQVLIACYRRALIYPIFRNFYLCNKVKTDLVKLFRRGKKSLIKVMIEIHQMFNASNDARYILNQLFIKDYLVFLQKCRAEELDELCNNIANVEISKNDLDLELVELEQAAEMVQQEEISIMQNEMAVQMASMSLLPGLQKHEQVCFDEESENDSDSSSDSSDSSYESSEELDSDDDSS